MEHSEEDRQEEARSPPLNVRQGLGEQAAEEHEEQREGEGAAQEGGVGAAMHSQVNLAEALFPTSDPTYGGSQRMELMAEEAMFQVQVPPHLVPTQGPVDNPPPQLPVDEDEPILPTGRLPEPPEGYDPTKAFEGKGKGKGKKRKKELDVWDAVKKEENRRLTVDVDQENIIPPLIRNDLGAIDIPLAMLLPASDLPPHIPPNDPNGDPVQLSEREPTQEAITNQMNVYNLRGYDPGKGYFLGVNRVFGKRVRRITEEDRNGMDPALRADLEKWEAEILRGAVLKDVKCCWVQRNVLGYYVFLIDGNTRCLGWKLAIRLNTTPFKKVPRVHLKLAEVTLEDCRTLVLLSEEINESETHAQMPTNMLQKLHLLHTKRKMTAKEVAVKVRPSTVKYLKQELNIDARTTKKNEATGHNVLVYCFLEDQMLLKRLCNLANGVDQNGKDLGRNWTKAEKDAVVKHEKSKMQKMLGAAGFNKVDSKGFPYWEDYLRRMNNMKHLTVEFANAEILTVQKELGLSAKGDIEIFEIYLAGEEKLERMALTLKKDTLEPMMVAWKVLLLGAEYAVDWLQEVGWVEAQKEGEKRQPMEFPGWKGSARQKYFKDAIPFWVWVKALLWGDYEHLIERPFVWMFLTTGINIRSRMNEDLKKGKPASCLEGVKKRILLMYFRSVAPDKIEDIRSPTGEEVLTMNQLADIGYKGLYQPFIPYAEKWAGITVDENGEKGLTVEDQEYFLKFETEALFEGERKGKKKWPDKGEDSRDLFGGKPMPLGVACALGVRTDSDFAGSAPRSIPALWKKEINAPAPGSGKLRLVTLSDIAKKLTVGKAGVEVEGESGGEEGEKEGGEKGKEGEGGVKEKEAEPEKEPELEVKTLERGEGKVVFLKFFGKGVEVVPEVEDVTDSIGFLLDLGESVKKFDGEEGGVDAAVFFAKPSLQKVEDRNR
ncbi:hypothetical protein KFL_011670020, partial [Klebsormidium nitens]